MLHIDSIRGRVLVLLGAAGLALSASAQRATLLTPHVPVMVSSGHAARIAPLTASQPLNLVLSLPLRNQDALTALLADLYNPASANFRQWLTPAQFDAQFGPTELDYKTLTRWAQNNGLTITATAGNRRVLSVQGTAAIVNLAFGINETTYHDSVRNRDFMAPDREPTMDIAIPVLAVSGLDTSNPKTSALKKQPDVESVSSPFANWQPAVMKPQISGSGPSNTYLPSDMRAAYYGTGSLTGTGQAVAIFSYDGYVAADPGKWYTAVSRSTTVPVTNVLTGGFDGGCELDSPCDDGEQVLDILQVQGMAPGLSHIYFYEGLSSAVELNQMVSDDTASVITSSWSGGDFGPASDTYFLQMAAQGQTYLNATGDSGGYNGFTFLPPGLDPYIVEVGGTDLTTVSAGGAWSAETAWADSGGGFFDPNIAIPSWQAASGVITGTNKGSALYRNSPDMAAEANFDNTTEINGVFSTGYGGTSYATPRIAGYIALANQQSATNGTGRLGFINASLYDFGQRSTASTTYHDITSGSNTVSTADEYNGVRTSYSATTGYDLVTGWGSPNGVGLLNLLTGPNFSLSMGATTVTLVRGATATLNITVNPINNFSGTPTFATSTLPAGVTAAFASTGTNTYALTLTSDGTSGTAATSVTITATYGSFSHAGTIALNTVKRTGYDFTISATAATAVQQASGNSVVTIQDAAGYDGPVDLTLGTLPAGVTAVFGTPSTSSTSNLTFSVSINSAPGTYTVLLTGTSAGYTVHTIPVTLTITGVTSVLPDGDFESATSPWSFTSTLNGGYLCSEACGYFQHAGVNYAYLNGWGATDTDTLYQTFTIPTASTVTLNFWLMIGTAETTTTAKDDNLTVSVVNAGGTSTTIATFSNLNHSNAYTLNTYDMSAFQGQTVTLKFAGVENNSKATAFFLDDISVVVH